MNIMRVKDKNGNWVDIPAIVGRDYVLTEEDKQEIADIVVERLSVYSGEMEDA
jgi:hypothetical protein